MFENIVIFVRIPKYRPALIVHLTFIYKSKYCVQNLPSFSDLVQIEMFWFTAQAGEPCETLWWNGRRMLFNLQIAAPAYRQSCWQPEHPVCMNEWPKEHAVAGVVTFRRTLFSHPLAYICFSFFSAFLPHNVVPPAEWGQAAVRVLQTLSCCQPVLRHFSLHACWLSHLQVFSSFAPPPPRPHHRAVTCWQGQNQNQKIESRGCLLFPEGCLNLI